MMFRAAVPAKTAARPRPPARRRAAARAAGAGPPADARGAAPPSPPPPRRPARAPAAGGRARRPAARPRRRRRPTTRATTPPRRRSRSGSPSEAEKAGLPPELPVMASLVESGVQNLHCGDATPSASSRCASASGTRATYAGYPDDPELQVKWFIDQALAVKRQRIAAGDATSAPTRRKWGEWIADVERPAEQYRGRYQLRLDEARGLLALRRQSSPPPTLITPPPLLFLGQRGRGAWSWSGWWGSASSALWVGVCVVGVVWS